MLPYLIFGAGISHPALRP